MGGSQSSHSPAPECHCYRCSLPGLAGFTAFPSQADHLSHHRDAILQPIIDGFKHHYRDMPALFWVACHKNYAAEQSPVYAQYQVQYTQQNP